MIRRLFRFVWSLVVLAAVIWFVFFVQLGERTLFEHVARIAQTDEAQDLGREVREAGSRVGDEARRAIEEGGDRPTPAGSQREAAPSDDGEPATEDSETTGATTSSADAVPPGPSRTAR